MNRNRIEIRLEDDSAKKVKANIAAQAILESLQEDGQIAVGVIVCILGAKQLQVGSAIVKHSDTIFLRQLSERVKDAAIQLIEEQGS